MKSKIITGLLVFAFGTTLAENLELPPFDPDVVESLSGMTYMPDKNNLDNLFGDQAVSELIFLATHDDSDPGIRIRAVHAIGQYDDSANAVEAIDFLEREILDLQATTTGSDILYLNAALRSLAAIQGSNALATTEPLLHHPQRDVRFAAVESLGLIGDNHSIEELRARQQIETVQQVKHAIDDAIRKISERL